MPNYVSSGSDFIVNTETGSNQFQPRIAHFADGSYVVIWTSISSDPNTSPYSIRAQLFDATGNRIGGEISVETHDNGSLLNPDVTVLADGSFVVVWQSEDSSHYGTTRVIAGQHFSASGTPIGGEFMVNLPNGAFVSAPSVTALAGGSYVVSWDDFYSQSVRARAFAADGTALGGELALANHGQNYGTIHTVQALSSGGFVAVWNQSDGSGQGVRAQLFTATGAEASGEFWANTQMADSQNGASVVELANGYFVVLWSSSNTAQDGSFSAIKAQIFTAAGVPVGGEFLVNQIATGYQGNAQATALADGGFLVAWQSTAGTGPYDNTLQARVFDASGAPVGGEFQADGTGFTQWSQLGGLATLADGTVRLTYSVSGGDGDGDGVLIRTLVPQSATQTAPSIVSDGGGASALVLVNEYTSFVTNVRAIDPDGPVATTFAIAGGVDAARFTIDAMTGRLSFVYTPEYANPADADGDNVYDVIISASDGALSDSQLVQVAVQDIVEAITVTSPTDVYTPENENLIYGGITATSNSGLPVYFMVIGGADAALVTITQDGYFIFAPGFAPDFETPADADGDNIFEVTVIMGDGYTTATADVRIHVTDVSELNFTSPSEVTMAENGSFVVAVQTSSAPGNVLYSLSGAGQFLFNIDYLTGELFFNNAPDYEFPSDSNYDNTYEVEVTAWDQTTGSQATQLVTITVTNEVEAPVIYSSDWTGMAENQTAALQVQAYSPEGNGVTYSIALVPGDNSDGALFAIDPVTGELSFLTAPNFEIPTDLGGNNLYEVVVAVTDQVTGLASTQRVYVNVADVVDYPVFTSSNAFTVAEGSIVAATLTASHPANHAPFFFLGGGADDALFTLDAVTGVLTFNAAPDHEAPGDAGGDNVYNLIAWVSDGSTFSSRGITVTVGNVNEAPVITSPGSISVAENASLVATITSADPEGQTRIYSITGGADAAHFAIDASTGVLSFIAAPNFEAPTDAGGDNVYDLVVSVSDGSLSTSQAIAVTVTNVNETPVITSSASFSVSENNTAVGTVTSTDPDGTPRTYSITGGADAAKFAIDTATGSLSFVAAPNFEVPTDTGGNNVYDLVVTASDGSLGTSQAIAVTVTNANEAPAFTSFGGGANGTASVAENSLFAGVPVAIDPEGGYVSYAIVGGADAAQFALNPGSNAIRFLANPDYEAPGDANGDRVYEIVIRATDPNGNSSDQTLAINITDVDEAPVFTSFGGASSGSVTVAEGLSSVTTLTATDPEGEAINFILWNGADLGRFAINGATGALSFNFSPDFEQPLDANHDNVYEVVVAADSGGTLRFQTVYVTIGNVNEAPIITSPAAFTVGENGTAVATLASSDPETNPRTWSITGGVDAARFAIDAQTGALVFVAAPDFESPSDAGGNSVYDLVVAVSDGSLSTSQAITVTVSNVNEAPTITSNGGGDTASIVRNEGASTAVTTVTSSDPDGNPRTYSITGGADAARFTINAATGLLSFVTSPNFEAPTDSNGDNIYQVVVTASDGSLSDSQTVSVTITNVNENLAITSNGGGDTASVTVNENSTVVTTVTAVDQDGTAPTFAIAGGADAAKFTINAATGALSFITGPNFEAPTDSNGDNVYQVEVRASDGTFGDYQLISVTVANVADGVTLNGDSKANSLTGTVAEDTINGLGGNDTLNGGAGADTINGGDGNDQIIGGAGADTLTGGLGADTFVFQSLADSSATATDMLTDFSTAQLDRISLSAIDANANLAGDQAFSWIGTGNFTGVAGQLRYYQAGGDTFVTGDVNGDGVGDFLIRIDPLVTLSATSFIL